jgi:hypothetical protein
MLARTDPKRMIDMVAETGADTVMIYAKDHWGNVYHETSVAHKHAAVGNDLLGEWLSAASAAGLQTTVFFSLMWDEFAGRANPDWLSRNADGSVKRWYGGWRFLSLNSPYRDYLFAHMSELVSNYDFDTLFVDPFNHRIGVNVPDYNAYDQQLFRAAYGRDIPVDLTGPDKALYMEFRDAFFARFLRELYGGIRGAGKDIKITHIYGGNTDYDDYLNVEGDPFGQDYYAPSMKAKVYRAYAEGRPLVVLTERFSRYWDFVPKTREQLSWEIATAYSHRAATMIVDHADINGELDANIYGDLRSVFTSLAPVEAAIDESDEVFAEVALLYHERDEELVLEPKRADLDPESQHLSTVYRGYLPDFVGAFKFLTESHTPFDAIVQTGLSREQLSAYRLVVIPNTLHMSADQAAAVRDYVAEGGCVVFTHRTATRDLCTRPLPSGVASFGLLDTDIEDPYSLSFISPAGPAEVPYIRVNAGNVYITPRTEYDVLGFVQLPAVQRTSERWVTHNEPPGRLTDRPAVIHGRYGKGQYVYFSSRIFRELLEQDIRGYRSYVRDALARVFEPSVTVKAPRTVEANYYSGAGRLRVFLTNLTPGRSAGRYDLLTTSPEPYSYPCNIEDVIPVGNVEIVVTGTVASAHDVAGNELEVAHRAGGGAAIRVPTLSVCDVVTVTWASP